MICNISNGLISDTVIVYMVHTHVHMCIYSKFVVFTNHSKGSQTNEFTRTQITVRNPSIKSIFQHSSYLGVFHCTEKLTTTQVFLILWCKWHETTKSKHSLLNSHFSLIWQHSEILHVVKFAEPSLRNSDSMWYGIGFLRMNSTRGPGHRPKNKRKITSGRKITVVPQIYNYQFWFLSHN